MLWIKLTVVKWLSRVHNCGFVMVRFQRICNGSYRTFWHSIACAWHLRGWQSTCSAGVSVSSTFLSIAMFNTLVSCLLTHVFKVPTMFWILFLWETPNFDKLSFEFPLIIAELYFTWNSYLKKNNALPQGFLTYGSLSHSMRVTIKLFNKLKFPLSQAITTRYHEWKYAESTVDMCVNKRLTPYVCYPGRSGPL